MSTRRQLNREALTARCNKLRIQKAVVFELAGLNRESLGAAYANGLGPRLRLELCEVLRMSEQELFK